MNNQERIKKYKQEYCKKCKNKEKQDCSIRVFVLEKTIYTKCDYYEREEKSKKRQLYQLRLLLL